MKPEETKGSGRLVIVGAGDFGKIAADYFEQNTDYKPAALAAERAFLPEKREYRGLPIEAFEDLPAKYPPEKFSAFVALIYTRLNRDRTRLLAAMRNAGYRIASYLSPAAFISPDSDVGENVFVFEHNVIQTGCVLEDNVILWSGNHVGHESVLRKNCFLASHVVVSGHCDIGENTFIGVNAAIGHNVSIGRDCTIGAGAVIARNIPDDAAVQPEHSPVRENISRRLWKVRE